MQSSGLTTTEFQDIAIDLLPMADQPPMNLSPMNLPPMNVPPMNQSAMNQPPYLEYASSGGPPTQPIPTGPLPVTFNGLHNAQPPRTRLEAAIMMIIGPIGGQQFSHADLPPHTDNQSATGSWARRLPIDWSRPYMRQPEDLRYWPVERLHYHHSTPEERMIAAGIDAPFHSRDTGPGPESCPPPSNWSCMWDEDAAQIRLENPRAMEFEIQGLIQESHNTAPADLCRHPRVARANEYNQLMWQRFRDEYLRIEVGLADGFTYAIASWLRSKVGKQAPPQYDSD